MAWLSSNLGKVRKQLFSRPSGHLYAIALIEKLAAIFPSIERVRFARDRRHHGQIQNQPSGHVPPTALAMKDEIPSLIGHSFSTAASPPANWRLGPSDAGPDSAEPKLSRGSLIVQRVVDARLECLVGFLSALLT